MKSAEEWRREWVFGTCPANHNWTNLESGSIHCGKCLRDTIAKAQVDALESAARRLAQLGDQLGARVLREMAEAAESEKAAGEERGT